VLAVKNIIKTPFIVINADDFYGKEGFKAVHEYLVNGGKSCMAGFVLKNTLSDNGGVTRGICKMDEDNNLTEVVETKNIVKTADGAEADGVAVDVNSLVSMNMWGLTPDFLDVLEDGFKEFFEKEVPGNPLKAEYLIPIFIGELLKEKISVGAERQRRYRAMKRWRADPTEENFWGVVVAYAGVKFKTYSGLPFSYAIKKGKNGEYTKELWIDRREKSKSLAWSSVLLALGNIKGEVIDRPKALGDIRGVTYIYGTRTI